MNSSDRGDFERELAVLFAAIDKPVTEARSEAFWRGLAKMSMLEFSRSVERLLQDLQEGEAPRYFSVADVWAARRRLRAAPVVYVHEQPIQQQPMDGWDVRANELLLKHLATRLGADPRAYGPLTAFVPRTPAPCYSPEQERATGVLVAYKRAWAADMREAANAANEVAIETQQEAWADCMARAEEIITHRVKQPTLLEVRA